MAQFVASHGCKLHRKTIVNVEVHKIRVQGSVFQEIRRLCGDANQGNDAIVAIDDSKTP